MLSALCRNEIHPVPLYLNNFVSMSIQCSNFNASGNRKKKL